MTSRTDRRRVRLASRAGLLLVASALVVGAVVASGGPRQASAQVVGAPSDIPAPLQTPQLLTDAAFENGLSPWQASPGENWAVYSSPTVEDQRYLETNTGSAGPGGNIYQDDGVAPSQGHSYMASLLLRSPTGTPATVGLVLWALGSATEAGQTVVTLSGTAWSPESVELDVAQAGESDLRLQVFVETPGVNVDLDGVALQDAGLADASFESGFSPWQVTPGENWAVYSGSSALDQHYLETNTGTAGSAGAVYQDVSTTPLQGHSYLGSMLLRSPDGTPATITLQLSALGGSDSAQTQVTVPGSSWIRASVELDVAEEGDTGLRLELALGNTAVNIDVDGAALEDDQVADANFESGFAPWQATPGQNWAIYNGSSAVDQDYLETNTGTAGAGGTVYQDIDATPLEGHSDTATLLLRSAEGAPATVDLVLWALGGSSAEAGQTVVTLSGTAWTPVSVDLDVVESNATSLRLQLFVDTTGVNVDLDGADLAVGADFASLTALRQRIVAIAESQDQYQAHVIETPIGSNCNPYSAFFGRGSSVGSYGLTCAPGTLSEEWCSDFAQWVWAEAGDDPGGVTGWAFTWVDWGEANGSFEPGPTDSPEPGDAVVWGDMGSQYGQHVGIVVGVADGQIDVVSGNSGPEDANGDVYSVWESGYFDPTTSSIGPYTIVGYSAPDGFSDS